MNRVGAVLTMLAATTVAVAAQAAHISVDFHDSTALTMQGVLQQGPNQTCEGPDGTLELHPHPYVFNNNDPGEDHLYQAYELYNNGPSRCVDVELSWIAQDCGDLGIGMSLYLDSFNPDDPTENFLSHTFEIERDFFVVGVDDWHRNDFRHSYGFYRDELQNYHLDYMQAFAEAPALSRIIVVLDSLDVPGNIRNCPIDDATASLHIDSAELSLKPLSISVNDSSNYEYNPPPGVAKMPFYVSLSAQLNETLTVNWQTSAGTATADVDYDESSGSVVFEPGQTLKLVEVPILSDTDFPETDGVSETFNFTLTTTNPPAIPIADGSAIAKIWEDDDPSALCRITSYPAGPLPPGKVGQLYGPVELDPAGGEVAGDYLWEIVAGATPPGVPLTTFISLNDLQLHGRLSGTPTQSGDFAFTVELGCPVSKGGHEPIEVQYSIHIEPEDPEVILTLTDAEELESDAGFTPILPLIQLSGPLDYDLYLEVRLYDSSATLADSDYNALPPAQQILIPANTTSEPIPLEIVGDEIVENNEIFKVELRTVVEQTVLATATATILNDDEPDEPEGEPREIPTLGDVGLAGFALALAGAAAARLRRRR